MSSADSHEPLLQDSRIVSYGSTMGADTFTPATPGSAPQDNYDSEHGSSKPPSKFLSVFRSVPFQIAVACGVSFTAPGMWDALNNLGAGGAAEPYAGELDNALASHILQDNTDTSNLQYLPLTRWCTACSFSYASLQVASTTGLV